MRALTLATLSIAAITVATPAQAQRDGRDGPWVRPQSQPHSQPQPVRYPPRSVPTTRIEPPRTEVAGRWGPMVGGRWHAGTRAPGGWNAYRRPVRGWTLPSYWIGGGFWIDDWSSWGLSRPPYGYGWLRYYDDAVLADRNGRVWDSVSGVDWYGGGGAATAYAGSGYAAAAAGGGGGGGYGRGYGARYEAPDHDEYEEDDRHARRSIPARPYPGEYAPSRCVSACGSQGGGYARGYYGGGGYYMVGPTVTTIVIQSGAATTTTVTEEVIEEVEEVRTYRAPVKTVRRYPSKTVRRSTKGCNC